MKNVVKVFVSLACCIVMFLSVLPMGLAEHSHSWNWVEAGNLHYQECDCTATQNTHSNGDGTGGCTLKCCGGNHEQYSWQIRADGKHIYACDDCGTLDTSLTHANGEGDQTTCDMECCGAHQAYQWLVRADGKHVYACPSCGLEDASQTHDNGFCDDIPCDCRLDCCGGAHKLQWTAEGDNNIHHYQRCTKCSWVKSESIHDADDRDGDLLLCDFCHVHWYGDFCNNGDNTHSASCKKGKCKYVGTIRCTHVEFTIPGAGENGGDRVISVCPVCGDAAQDGTFASIQGATAIGGPKGMDFLCRTTMVNDSLQFIVVAFEWSGRPKLPDGEITVTIPGDALIGSSFTGANSVVNADGSVSFTLTIEKPGAAMILVQK